MSEESPLGKDSEYPDEYAPGALFAIPRSNGRTALGLGDKLPFSGSDLWTAWELTWLNMDGRPAVATAVISVPASSPNIIESKSLKLYLGSFAMSRFEKRSDVRQAIAKDLQDCVGVAVDVDVWPPSASYRHAIEDPYGDCVDDEDAGCEDREVNPALLRTVDGDPVMETLHSNLLRSLCPVTNQPDLGSVMIRYEGPQIDRGSLVRYIVSFRQHQDFHEACVERMFLDIAECCGAEKLTVYARYQRRGGIDINPFRTNFETELPNWRTWRQ